VNKHGCLRVLHVYVCLGAGDFANYAHRSGSRGRRELKVRAAIVAGGSGSSPIMRLRSPGCISAIGAPEVRGRGRSRRLHTGYRPA